MRRMQSLWRRMRSIVSKDSKNAELSEELQYHLARNVEENMARGMSEHEAVAAARASFGGWAATIEESYQARGTAWVDDFIQDLRYGLRTLAKHQTFSLFSILTLSLGIGASTAIFSVANAVLLRSLPYPHPEQLVYLFTPSTQLLHMGIPAEVFPPSFADFSDLKEESHSFAEMTLFQQTSFNLAGGDQVARVGAARVDAAFFRTLRSQPQIGRAIDDQDQKAGSDHVVIISHALWQELFGRATNVLDHTLKLNGESYRIVGVMPSGFEFPHRSDLPAGFGKIKRTQIWVPAAFSSQQMACRDGCGAFAVGRLRDGVQLAEAQSELRNIMGHLDSLHNPSLRDFGAYLESLRDMSVGPVKPLLRLLFGAVGLVLLIACTNAANLLIARAESRAHEMGVRATLGARRERLFRQMITESLLLGLAAGIVGTLLAWLCLHGLLRIMPLDIPRLENATLDTSVLCFLLGVTILTTLLFGVVPSLTAARINIVAFLRHGGMRGVIGGRPALRKGLAVAQVALLIVLLTATGLLLRSYARVLATPVGFAPSTVTAGIEFAPPIDGSSLNPRYNTADKRRRFFQDVIDQLQRTSGIEAAGWIDVLPLSRSEMMMNVEIEGYANEKKPLVEVRRVSPGFFSAMQIPLRNGNDFGTGNGENDPLAAVVNEAFAKQYFGKTDAIGEHIRISAERPWMTVEGVIADVRNVSLEVSAAPQVYTCLWQADTNVMPANAANIAVRSILPQAIVVSNLRNIVKGIDPELAVADAQTMKTLEFEVSSQRLFQTVLLTVFSGTSLLLAVIGIYGILASSVQQRTGEIGIRVALGSTRSEVATLFVNEGLRLVSIGLGLGILISLGLSRVVAGFLYDVPGIDPVTYATVALLLLAATLAACLVPSLRAAKVDPVIALRCE